MNAGKIDAGDGLARLIRRIRRCTRYGIVCLLLFMGHYASGGPGEEDRRFLPLPSSPLEFEATAYCDYGITKSGALVERGIVAGDPRVLPLGSLIRLEDTPYRGVYQVLDTGGLVKGKIIDIYMPSLDEALQFGRRKVHVVVLRYGLPKPRAPLALD